MLHKVYMWRGGSGGTDRFLMYARTLMKAAHVRRFIITPQSDAGWEVREETDSAVVRQAHYQDWHRVERARRAFALEAQVLHRSGWVEK
jgi:hypothetical protein